MGESVNEKFPSNSFTVEPKKPDRKIPEKVVKGHVGQKKKSVKKTFFETFLKSDLETVANHIIFDVLIPGIQNTLFDIGDGALKMLLFGDKEGSRTRRDRDRSYVYTNYGSSFNRRREREDDKNDTPRYRSIVDDLIFDTRGDAEDVLSEMIDYIDEYGAVSVKELYSFAGMDSDYTKEKYGWTNLNRAEVIRVREGYSLKLPKPIVID